MSIFKIDTNSTSDEECWEKVVEFYRKGFLCDVRLKGKYESKMAHNYVLSALCPTGPWADIGTIVNSSNVTELDVSSLFKRPGVLTGVIDYIYVNEIELTDVTVYPVLDVAKQLKLTELVSICAQCLLEYLQASNVLDTLNVAYQMNIKNLMEVCLAFSREVFDELIESESLQLLSKDFITFFMNQSLITSVDPAKLAFFLLRWILGNTKDVYLLKDFLRNVDINQFQFREAYSMINELATIPDYMTQTFRVIEKLHFKSPASVTLNNIDNSPLSGRCVIVRDCKASIVYYIASGKWLTIPHTSYKYVISLFQKKLFCSNERMSPHSIDVLDINGVQTVENIECPSNYLGPIFYKNDFYILAEYRRKGFYQYKLLHKKYLNGVYFFEQCFQFCTSISAQRPIKDFFYYNDEGYTILVFITNLNCSTSVVGRDYSFVFRLNWLPYSIATLIKAQPAISGYNLSSKNFTYCRQKLYVLGNDIGDKIYNAIKLNVSFTTYIKVFELSSDVKLNKKYLKIPKLGLNYLPLKPKESSGHEIMRHNDIQLQPIDGKIFVVAHRAPAIVYCFEIDLLTGLLKITTPIPLNGISELEVTCFYCEDSIIEILPEQKKSFALVEGPIFNGCNLHTL